MLTLERVHQLLSLDIETGHLTWKMPVGGRTTTGSRAGSLGAGGYRWLKIDDRMYREHTVVWFMLTGEWLPRKVDHADRDRSNNSPSNLRRATESEQRANAAIRCDNKSGYRGVWKHSIVDKWQAEVRMNGKKHYLGLFETKEEAAEVARLKRLELFGQFAPSYDAAIPGA